MLLAHLMSAGRSRSNSRKSDCTLGMGVSGRRVHSHLRIHAAGRHRNDPGPAPAWSPLTAVIRFAGREGSFAVDRTGILIQLTHGSVSFLGRSRRIRPGQGVSQQDAASFAGADFSLHRNPKGNGCRAGFRSARMAQAGGCGRRAGIVGQRAAGRAVDWKFVADAKLDRDAREELLACLS